MKHWFKDSSFRSLLTNSSYLAVSQGVAALCGLATLAFAGRGLGTTLFGMLVLVHSYAQLASGIAKFQSWQLIVRFGAPALAKGEEQPFKEATGFALGLDLISGFGGMLVAIALLPFVAPLLHIPAEYVPYAMLYCLLLPTMAAATPIGVMRVLNRFDLIAVQGTITPISRAVMAFAAWLSDADLLTYLAIWFVSDLLGDVYLWIVAWRELRRKRLQHGIRPRLRPRQLQGAWGFAINVNLANSLNVARGPLSQLLVGMILGPVAAGLYQIGRTIAESIEKPADLLNKAFYPEIMRLDVATKKPWKLMLRGAALSALVGAAAGLIIVLGGERIIAAIFGREYVASYGVMAILLIGSFASVVTFPVTPMLYALHRTGLPVSAKAAGIVVSLVLLYPLAGALGLKGAALAYLGGTLLTIAVSVSALASSYRSLRRTPSA